MVLAPLGFTWLVITSDRLALLRLTLPRRVRGQIKAVERAIEEEQSCSTVLHLIVASRGAMSSLMTELIEDHVRHMWSTQ